MDDGNVIINHPFSSSFLLGMIKREKKKVELSEEYCNLARARTQNDKASHTFTTNLRIFGGVQADTVQIPLILIRSKVW